MYPVLAVAVATHDGDRVFDQLRRWPHERTCDCSMRTLNVSDVRSKQLRSDERRSCGWLARAAWLLHLGNFCWKFVQSQLNWRFRARTHAHHRLHCRHRWHHHERRSR
jgi:hypothetical protein